MEFFLRFTVIFLFILLFNINSLNYILIIRYTKTCIFMLTTNILFVCETIDTSRGRQAFANFVQIREIKSFAKYLSNRESFPRTGTVRKNSFVFFLNYFFRLSMSYVQITKEFVLYSSCPLIIFWSGLFTFTGP